MSTKNISFAIFVFLFLCLLDGIYTVNQIEQVVVTRFGEPVRVIKDPGLHMKFPLLEKMTFFDKRLMSIELSALEVTLGDKRRIMVDAFKEALSEMKIELDDEVAGKFIDKTVSEKIFA